MELTWKRYVITLRIQRKQVDSVADSGRKQVSTPPLPAKGREEVERQYLLASGNRYIAPTR